MNRIEQKNSGGTLLIYVVIIFLATVAAFGLVGRNIAFDSKAKLTQQRVQSLEQVKERLKTFALLAPYLYISSTDTGSGYKDIEQVPGPGYFPCPDYDGDGDSETTCGNPSPPAYQNRSVTLSSLATSPVANVGYVPQFVKSRLYQVLSDHQVKPLYVVDTKFVVNNQCFGNIFPVNLYMDARDYANASTGTLSAAITPTPLCGGVSTLIDAGGRGVALNLAYVETVAATAGDVNQAVANDFLNNKTLTMNTLMACDTTTCLDDNGNQNPYISPGQAFFDPALMPRIKINNRPFYVFALISPGDNGQFETTVGPGSYVKGGAATDDGTVNIQQGGDDIVIGLHFLEWAKMLQERLCSSRAWYSDIVQNYLAETDVAKRNRLWLFRHDEDGSEGYTNKSGSNWSDQIYPAAFSPDKLPSFSICDLEIIDQ